MSLMREFTNRSTSRNEEQLRLEDEAKSFITQQNQWNNQIGEVVRALTDSTTIKIPTQQPRTNLVMETHNSMLENSWIRELPNSFGACSSGTLGMIYKT